MFLKLFNYLYGFGEYVMKGLNDIIDKCEMVYKKNKNYFSIVTLISRLYLRFLETGSFGYADNAFFISVKSFKNNTHNIVYLLAAAFFETETGRHSSAFKRISVCDNYRVYLKNNQPEIYAFYLYINAIVMFRQKAAKESFRIYREIVGLLEQNNNLYFALLLLACLDIEYDNFGRAKKRLEYYVDNASGSAIFYICLYKYFKSKNKSIYCTLKLFIPFIKWGVSHGVNLRAIISIYSDRVCELFWNNKELGFKLYSLYEDEEILKEICISFIEKKDLSYDAFQYYSAAVKKQLFVPGLNNFFIHSSFYNDRTDFGIYPIKMFLKFGDMSDDIKPFVYYLVLTNKKFFEMLKMYFSDIVDFGVSSVKKDLSGRYYNSIYKFIIENRNKFNVQPVYINQMEEILFYQLFLYELEIENKNIRYCFVFEKNKEKASVYDVNNGKCDISMTSESADFFMEDAKKQFVDSDFSVKRYVENVSFGLCRMFYSEGYASDELDMALANYYIKNEKFDNDCIEIFERVLKLDISYDFRMKILLAAGNLYYFNMDFDKALICFKNIEIKYVKDKFIKNVFNVFIEKRMFDAAAEIIIERGYCIPDDMLFDGIVKLIEIERLCPILAKSVFELVLKAKYNSHMIKLLTQYYRGGRNDWLLICDTLYAMGTPNKCVNEKLINISMQTRIFDEKVQDVFLATFQNDRKNKLIDEFAEYCCYEMIVNLVRPKYETIFILEKLFIENNNEMISYALSHTYLTYNIHTENSDRVIRAAFIFMKKRNLIFTVFKSIENDFINDPYIEKNYPFIYYAPSDKSVLFYFREKGDFDFYSKPMAYLDFGIYYINIPIFFGEEIEYYICENKEKGSIETPKKTVINESVNIHNESDEDPFFEINNSIIYENIYRYEEAEKLISRHIRKNNELRVNLL